MNDGGGLMRVTSGGGPGIVALGSGATVAPESGPIVAKAGFFDHGPQLIFTDLRL